MALKSIEENIFLAIEYYLANPTTQNANKIKELSNSLRSKAYTLAQEKYPNKSKIGADEFQPLLLELVEQQAVSASSVSTRLTLNVDYDKSNSEHENDRQYIFRLSQEQQQQINKLINEMLSQAATTNLSPDGLVFAYAGYIERYSPKTNPSKFSYCDSHIANIYDQNAKLNFKGLELKDRGFEKAGTVLIEAAKQIKDNQESDEAQNNKDSQILSILNSAYEAPEVNEHRGTIKQLIINFIILLTGPIGLVGLAITAAHRNSFWYSPNTDAANKVEQFQNLISVS